MSKLISTLPQRIRDRALECQMEEKSDYYRRETDILVAAFDFPSTKEGMSIWADVNGGNYTPFYTFHNIKPHGGKREGAKRPLKYGDPTVQATYYVPSKKKPIIDKMVKDKLKEWVVKSANPRKAKPIDRFPCDDEQDDN